MSNRSEAARRAWETIQARKAAGFYASREACRSSFGEFRPRGESSPGIRREVEPGGSFLIRRLSGRYSSILNEA